MASPYDKLLKPCPFCGGKAHIKTMRAGEDCVDSWAECGECFAKTDAYEGAFGQPEAAVSMWNDRRGAVLGINAALLEALQAARDHGAMTGAEWVIKKGLCGKTCGSRHVGIHS